MASPRWRALRALAWELGAPHPEWLRPSRIPLTIVCGSPGAGKSTYVAEHKGERDLVIDLDEIGARLSGRPQHDWDSAWLDRAIHFRNQYLAALSSRASDAWPAAWFIVGEPAGEKRSWWAAKLAARTVVLVQTEMDACLSRRPEKAEAIRRWFSAYSRRDADLIVSGQTWAEAA